MNYSLLTQKMTNKPNHIDIRIPVERKREREREREVKKVVRQCVFKVQADAITHDVIDGTKYCNK